VPRVILHLDLDAFFCAVEELYNPELAGKPFAVGARPESRGVVASCSYAARQFGIHSAMPMGRALQLCPRLIIVPTRHGVYRQLSQQVMAILDEVTPLVEKVSIDEAYLDVSDLPEPPGAIARRLQERIQVELNLPCSIGAASSKLVAKIANDAGKAANRGGAPPRAITVVPPGQEAGFLAPLPVQALHGVGPKTAARLAELGVQTIGDLAGVPEFELKQRFGKSGQEMALRARGIDDRPVIIEHETKSISQETTFARDISSQETLLKTLGEQSAGVARQLQRSGLCCLTVRIKIRWSDFTTLTRQVSLPQPSDQEGRIYQAAQFLFHKTWPPGRPVRLIGVGASRLRPAVRQYALWEEE
jgi:DNA polymerase IV